MDRGLVILLGLVLWAGTVDASGEEGSAAERLASRLGEPDRESRLQAEEALRALARKAPEAVAQLVGDLDLARRALALRALAGAGTKRAAEAALRFASTPEPEVFGALVRGLVRGGRTAIFADPPADLEAARKKALEGLRYRWRLEEELVRLKPPNGGTGHYDGQFARVGKLGPNAYPILFAIVRNRAHPLPGEGADGSYQPIHPEMGRFERKELRTLVAHGFGQLVGPEDKATRKALRNLFDAYWALKPRYVRPHAPPDEHSFEWQELAPNLAYSLHDLGDRAPAVKWLRHLQDQEYRGSAFATWELGYALIRVGQKEAGETKYQALLDREGGLSKHLAAYNLACNFSMRSKREPRLRADHRKRALDYLEQAVHRFRFYDWQWMEEDRDLDAIRKEPRYQRLLAFLKKRYPDRRKSVVEKDLRKILKPKPK